MHISKIGWHPWFQLHLVGAKQNLKSYWVDFEYKWVNLLYPRSLFKPQIATVFLPPFVDDNLYIDLVARDRNEKAVFRAKDPHDPSHVEAGTCTKVF